MQTKELQTMLLALGYDLGKAGADGVFGRLTVAAVKAFQADHGVQVQWPGTVGPKTEAALSEAYTKKTGASSSWSPATVLLPWYTEAARLQGVTEIAGTKSSGTILGWAKALGGWVASYFDNDDIPWCGLFAAHCVGATLPDEPLPSNPLGALNWSTFGIACEPQPGAILTFSRDGGGHVGFYVSEDDTYFHVLGGNQSNKVNVTKVAKSRHKATRWPKTAPTPTGKRVKAAFSGTVSTNDPEEAPMSLLKATLQRAVFAASTRSDVPLSPMASTVVTDAIAEALPPARAMESLWPQIARYAVAIALAFLAGIGVATAGDIQVIMQVLRDLSSQAITPEVATTAAGALAPVLWRISSTLWARWRARGAS